MRKLRMTLPTILLTAVVAVAVLFVLGRLFVQYRSPMPGDLGVREGELVDCPDTPNCVSTQAPPENSGQRVEPIPYAGDMDEARRQLVAIIGDMPRARVIADEPHYIHAEFRSLVWGFVDDVEFFLDDDSGLIHSRSAARLGYSDLDVNRDRYETIRQAFESREN